MMLLLVLTIGSLPKYTLSYDDWSDINRRWIYHDIDRSPFSFYTNSTRGSSNRVFFELFGPNLALLYDIDWSFNTFEVKISHECGGRSMRNIPEELGELQTWTLIKTDDTTLTLLLNGRVTLVINDDNFPLCKMIKLASKSNVRSLKFYTYDSATIGYKNETLDFVPINPAMIKFDLSRTPLQLTMEDQRNKLLLVYFFDEVGRKLLFFGMYTVTHHYRLGYCDGSWVYRLDYVPKTKDKIWTITKSSASFAVFCNEVRVLHVLFADVDPSQYPNCDGWKKVAHVGLGYGLVGRQYRPYKDYLEEPLLTTAAKESVSKGEDVAIMCLVKGYPVKEVTLTVTNIATTANDVVYTVRAEDETQAVVFIHKADCGDETYVCSVALITGYNFTFTFQGAVGITPSVYIHAPIVKNETDPSDCERYTETIRSKRNRNSARYGITEVAPYNAVLSIHIMVLDSFIIKYYYQNRKKFVPVMFLMIALADFLTASGTFLYFIGGAMYTSELVNEVTIRALFSIYHIFGHFTIICSVYFNVILAVVRAVNLSWSFYQVKYKVVKIVTVVGCSLAFVLLVGDLITLFTRYFVSNSINLVGHFIFRQDLGLHFLQTMSSYIWKEPTDFEVADKITATFLLILMFLVPVFLVLAAMGAIIVNYCCGGKLEGMSNQKQKNHVTLTICLVSLLFLVCFTPVAIFTIYSFYINYSDLFAVINFDSAAIYFQSSKLPWLSKMILTKSIFTSTLPLINGSLAPVILISRSDNLRNNMIQIILSAVGRDRSAVKAKPKPKFGLKKTRT